jgi:hypothetical protein
MPVFSLYTYYSGGYGDFIRSLLAFFAYCKENNIEHKLYIPNHPMNKCFECITENLNYPNKAFIDMSKYDTKLITDELDKCKDETCNVIIRSNTFDFVSNELLKKYASEFKTFLKFSDIVKNKIVMLSNQINNIEYTSIHIRCGDKFMECISQCTKDDIRINPKDEMLHKKITKAINYLKINYNLPICIFTDVQSLKNKICDQYGLFCFNTEIHHSACYGGSDNGFIDTVAEFELLGKSKAIIKFSNTGFAYWSAFINDVPLFIYDDTKDDIVPFANLKY